MLCFFKNFHWRKISRLNFEKQNTLYKKQCFYLVLYDHRPEAMYVRALQNQLTFPIPSCN